MIYFILILQTDQQAEEGLWVVAFIFLFVIVLGIWIKISDYNDRKYIEKNTFNIPVTTTTAT